MGMLSDIEFRHINDISVKADEETKRRNRELCERFPFLIPRNVFSGKKITDCIGPNGEEGYWPGTPEDHPTYDYEYTVLDDLPDGWKLAFGEQMSAEIQAELDEYDPDDGAFVVQTKEKYGRMEMYMNYYPGDAHEIIEKYGDMSEHICVGCGKPATVRSTGWVSPWCDECAASFKGMFGSYRPIEVKTNES